MKRDRNLTSFCEEMMDMRCSFEMLVNYVVQDNATWAEQTVIVFLDNSAKNLL